jgi:hypothetical protein
VENVVFTSRNSNSSHFLEEWNSYSMEWTPIQLNNSYSYKIVIPFQGLIPRTKQGLNDG